MTEERIDPNVTEEATTAECMPECNENASSAENTPISQEETWLQLNPQKRSAELDYLYGADWGFPVQFPENGVLLQPVKINDWILCLELDSSFPQRTDNGEIPARAHFVFPDAGKLLTVLPANLHSQVCFVSPADAYIQFGKSFDREYKKYLEDQGKGTMLSVLYQHTKDWVCSAQKQVEAVKRNTGRRGGFSFLPHRRNLDDSLFDPYSMQRPKYVDGRKTHRAPVNPRCHKVVLSDRAYIQILNESQARIQTETGGLLLGHYHEGVWYVVEASDPGINAKFFGSYHEGDDVYENHVCGVISRTYKYPLVFLGMWHRHPGSLDTFSGTDDGTNYKYAASAGNGCISAIINYDPEFRITFYYVEQGGPSRILYTCVDVEVGNDKFVNPDMMRIASQDDVMKRMRHERF